MSVFMSIYVSHGNPSGLRFTNLGLGLPPDFIRHNPLAHGRYGKILYAAPKSGCAVGQGDEIGTKRLAINEDDVAANFQSRLSFGPADSVLKCAGISHQRS